MVSTRVRCIVVEVPVDCESIAHRLRRPARELLPWADPYIARLIRNLQDEVREERAEQHRSLGAGASRHELLRGEAPPPATCPPIEFEVPTEEDWPLLHDVE